MVSFTLLGPLGVLVDGSSAAPTAAKPRALLALLLLNANRTVTLDRIIDELWPEAPPETVGKAIQTYVSQLRKLVGEEALRRRGLGYRLSMPENALDSERFERLLKQARAELEALQPTAARKTLTAALALWQGEALEDVDAAFAREAAARLGELRLEAIESELDCELRLGRHTAVVPELERLVERYPRRERLVELTMLALYRSGRQADALALYRDTRRSFVEDLGLEPGRGLQELERAMLRQETSLEARTPAGPAPAAGAPGASRRLRWALLGVGIACALLAAGLYGVLARDGSRTAATPPAPSLRPFVAKLEGLVAQSREGRLEIARIAGAASGCKLPPSRALVRLDTVERNRQSLLEQVAALSVPDDRTAIELSRRFQAAVQASIASDWRYREWLLGLRRHCTPKAAAQALAQTQAGDARATAAKQAFVAVFNPVARSFDQRTWRAGAI